MGKEGERYVDISLSHPVRSDQSERKVLNFRITYERNNQFFSLNEMRNNNFFLFVSIMRGEYTMTELT